MSLQSRLWRSKQCVLSPRVGLCSTEQVALLRLVGDGRPACSFEGVMTQGDLQAPGVHAHIW